MTVGDPLRRAIAEDAELESIEALLGKPVELTEHETQRRALLIHIQDQQMKINRIREHLASQSNDGEDYVEIHPLLLILHGWIFDDL